MIKRLLSCALALPLVTTQLVHRTAVWCGSVGLVTWAVRLAHGKLFMSQDAAIRKAFPDAERVDRKTLYLTPEQIQEIEKSAKARVDSSVISYYQGRKGNAFLGTAFFDTRLVRTMPMTTMTVVNPDGSLAFVEVLSFYEPEDYLPRLRWLDLFKGKSFSDRLRLRRDIPNVTGATLSCQTISDGVRAQLAIYQTLR